MPFEIDQRLTDSSLLVEHLFLSDLLLKNASGFPWLILVPRVKDVQELHQLSELQSQQLMSEITQISRIMTEVFKPDKINTAALGNIVPQLHVHVIARYQQDKFWPDSIWQPGFSAACYESSASEAIIKELRLQLLKR